MTEPPRLDVVAAARSIILPTEPPLGSSPEVAGTIERANTPAEPRLPAGSKRS